LSVRYDNVVEIDGAQPVKVALPGQAEPRRWDELCEALHLSGSMLYASHHIKPVITSLHYAPPQDYELASLHGTVIVTVDVHEDGTPTASLKTSSGNDTMDYVAVDWMKNVHWLPAMWWGRPTEESFDLLVAFGYGGHPLDVHTSAAPQTR